VNNSHAYLPMYGAARAGVAEFTSGLAREGTRCGISVNTVAPRAHTRDHAYLMDLDPTSDLPGSAPPEPLQKVLHDNAAPVYDLT
jgi:NAD(P)-dependent dehydrogenase (short-subunit alcohol dehydrogenase family)